MKINTLVFLVFFSAFAFFSCKADPAKVVVASFDSGSVTLKESLDEYKNLSDEEKKSYKNKEDLSKFVRKIVLEKIIVKKAVQDSFDKNDTFINKIEETKNNIAYSILKKRNVTSKINITEADYAKYKKIYEVYQIVKKTDTLDKKDIEKSKKTLLEISKSIKNLDDFKEMAKKNSDDITSESGGLLGKIRLGIMEDEIDKEIQSIGIGKVSKIIETNVGLHLIFVNSIDDISIKELLKDSGLYEILYKQQEEKYENQWYDSLLSDFSLRIDKNELKKKIADEKTIIEYKDKKISRKEVLETVSKFRQGGAFPEPTQEELLELVKKMAIKIILDNQFKDNSLINSNEFKERLEKEKKFLMIKEYIDKNLDIKKPSDDEIKSFYNDNLKTLFSFKQENGKVEVQKLETAKDFIIQKISMKNIQEARYSLYRKLIDDDHYKIDEKQLEILNKELKK